MFIPENVGYQTELDHEFAMDLKKVKTGLDFFGFLKRWNYWLDEETKENIGWRDWKWIKPLLDDCRREGCCPTEKHKPAMSLAMPSKIFYISLVASEYKVPWGTAYIRCRERGIIDY